MPSRFPPLSRRQRADKRRGPLKTGHQKGRKTDDTTLRPQANTDNTLPPRDEDQRVLARLLADGGLGTRRKIASWLESGRLLVNGSPALPGARLADITSLCLDGKDIPVPSFDSRSPRHIITYHKAVGELCSLHDPHGRPLTHQRLPPIKGRRWISVGRLDYMTEGLLLFTNDGELAYRLMHPSYQVKRVYVARVYGQVDEDLTQELLNGVLLDGRLARFTRIERMHKQDGRNTWLRATLTEGRNREVRRLFQEVGLKVNRLIRVQYGPCRLSIHSHPGNQRELTYDEKRQLTDLTGLTDPEDVPSP